MSKSHNDSLEDVKKSLGINEENIERYKLSGDFLYKKSFIGKMQKAYKDAKLFSEPKKAEVYFKAIIESEVEFAPAVMVDLGNLYAKRESEDKEKNGQSAIEWWIKAHEAGNKNALSNLREFYGCSFAFKDKKEYGFIEKDESGSSSNKDVDVSLSPKEERKKFDHASEVLESDTKRAEKNFLEIIQSGDEYVSESMFMLGIIYTGVSLEYKDVQKAVYWWRKADEMGNSAATRSLWSLYNWGGSRHELGSDKVLGALLSPELEKEMYKEALSKASVEPQKARELLQEISTFGIVYASDAMVDLGVLYARNKVGDKAANYQKAENWWRKAHGLGNKYGSFYLREMYEQGLMEKDTERAGLVDQPAKKLEENQDVATSNKRYNFDNIAKLSIKKILFREQKFSAKEEKEMYKEALSNSYVDPCSAEQGYLKIIESGKQYVPDAMTSLGILYVNQHFLAPDKKAIYQNYQKALELFEVAQGLGDECARDNLTSLSSSCFKYENSWDLKKVISNKISQFSKLSEDIEKIEKIEKIKQEASFLNK